MSNNNNNSQGNNKPESKKNISDEQMASIMETISGLKKLTEDQAKKLDKQNEKIDVLENASDHPQRRKKRLKIKTIKDNEREAKMYVLNLELTKDNEVIYFDEDRQRLIDEEMIQRELLVRRLVRTRSIRKGKDETFLLGLFDCIDKDKKKFQIEMPFAAMSQWRTTVKVQLFKKHTTPDKKTEGVVTKALRDEDGGIVDEYDIDLDVTTTHYHFDIKVLTDGAFKDMEFKRVPAQDLNLF